MADAMAMDRGAKPTAARPTAILWLTARPMARPPDWLARDIVDKIKNYFIYL